MQVQRTRVKPLKMRNQNISIPKRHRYSGVPEARKVGDRDVFLYPFCNGPVAKISNSMKTSISMWRGESFANGCLSGWKFIPNIKKTKNHKSWTPDTVGLTRKQKPRENQTKTKNWNQSTHRDDLRSWTGDMGWFFLLIFFCVLFFGLFHWCWPFWAKVAKTSRKPKEKKNVRHHGPPPPRAGHSVCLFFSNPLGEMMGIFDGDLIDAILW